MKSIIAALVILTMVACTPSRGGSEPTTFDSVMVTMENGTQWVYTQGDEYKPVGVGDNVYRVDAVSSLVSSVKAVKTNREYPKASDTWQLLKRKHRVMAITLQDGSVWYCDHTFCKSALEIIESVPTAVSVSYEDTADGSYGTLERTIELVNEHLELRELLQ